MHGNFRHIKEFPLNDDGTHQCSLCNGRITHRRRKVIEGRFSCHHCGNYRGITDDLIDAYHNSKSIYHINPRYRVMRDGRVLSTNGKIAFLVLQNKNGYNKIQISQKHYFVHRLVAEMFIGLAPSPKHQVHHINSIRDDNRVENLEWILPKRNCEYIQIDNIERQKIIKEASKHFNINELELLTKINVEDIKLILGHQNSPLKNF